MKNSPLQRTLFLCGDVMTGRGVDQVLPCPGDPALHEPSVRDARRYVELAEEAHGPLPRPLEPAAIWGDAVATLDAVQPACVPLPGGGRVIVLASASTTSGVPIHWGTNWGYDVSEPFVSFAHALIDGGVDVVHGHSSHHVRLLV